MNKMKITILSVVFAFCITGLKAQTYKIDTSSITFENKLRPCYLVKVDPEPKELKKAWAKYLKKNYQIKLKGISWFTNKDMLYGKDVTIAKVSAKRMDIYTRITENANGSEMKFMASFGYDFFIGPERFPAEFLGMKEILNSFLLEELNDYYTSALKSIVSSNSKLQKKIESLEKSIQKNEGKIAQNGASISSGSAKSDKLKTENNKMEDKNRNDKVEIQNLKSKIQENNTKADVLRQKQGNLLKN